MTGNSGRALGVLVFICAVGFGVHVAGQVPPAQPIVPDLNAPLPSPAPQQPGQIPPHGSQVPPVPMPGQGPTGAQAVPGGAPAQNQSAPPGAPTAVPAGAPMFGAGAAMQAEQILHEASEGPGHHPKALRASPTPKPFVPSEIETIGPTIIKVGDPRAILHTSMGDITIRLFTAYAPKTVRQFIDLARGERDWTEAKTGRTVRRPFYSNLIFHRVLPGYLIQTGCPFGSGRGGPGFVFSDEYSPVLRFEKAGMVAMAPQRDKKGEPTKDTNGSQFFITLAPMPDWNDKFTIFGEVEQGMSIVAKIGHAKVGPTERPIRRIFLNSVEIFDEATASTLGADKVPPATDAQPLTPEPLPPPAQ